MAGMPPKTVIIIFLLQKARLMRGRVVTFGQHPWPLGTHSAQSRKSGPHLHQQVCLVHHRHCCTISIPSMVTVLRSHYSFASIGQCLQAPSGGRDWTCCKTVRP